MRTRISKRLINAIQKDGYSLTYWEDYDYTRFHKIIIRKKTNKSGTRYADLIIMADTETSKRMVHPGPKDEDHYNHVCAWSIAFRSLSLNIVTLWGRKPSDLPICLQNVKDNLQDCEEMYVYFHNLPYDWIFLRKYFFTQWGTPEAQLNVKSLYPINIKFENGIFLKDSLIFAQRSLEKWGKDMQAEHAKAVGKWDYDAIRNFDSWIPSQDELLYIECDVLCGVECIDASMKALHKTISSLPLTATGIPRGEARNIGRKNKAHDWFLRLMPETYLEQMIHELTFMGGYTHANRFIKDLIFPGAYPMCSPFVKCKDFASSYPFVILAEMFPGERFWKLRKEVGPSYILENSKQYAFIFKIVGRNVRLRDPRSPMPYLAISHCMESINAICDNGRVLKVDYFEMYVTEIDFELIWEQYSFESIELQDVTCSRKEYLPKWFTDYVFSRFEGKTQLKGGDPVLYAIYKAMLNALYGMCAQRPVKEDIEEDYETGEFLPKTDFNYEEAYQKHLKNRNSFLPYSIGIYVTAYARRNLFILGKCVPAEEIWLYSDTDSVYATGFDEDAIKAYNAECIRKLKERGYKGVEHNGRVYNLGVAEDDGTYMQFKALHSKCYCKRPLTAEGEGFIMGEDLKITVAGVPKKGAKTLHNKIENFRVGTVFDGETSGKLQHTHYFIEKAFIDEHGNETGDSIELSPCDYIVNDPEHVNFEDLAIEEVLMIDYEKETAYE